MTTIAFTPVTVAENLFETAVFNPIITMAMAALYVDVPFLAAWPIKPILDFAVDKLKAKIYTGLNLTMDLKAISFSDDKRQAAFTSSSERLYILAKDKGLDSPEYKEAHSAEVAALVKFVSIAGS